MRGFVLSVDLTVVVILGKNTREKEIGRGTEKHSGNNSTIWFLSSMD
jgi:hypothetical protein